MNTCGPYRSRISYQKFFKCIVYRGFVSFLHANSTCFLCMETFSFIGKIAGLLAWALQCPRYWHSCHGHEYCLTCTAVLSTQQNRKSLKLRDFRKSKKIRWCRSQEIRKFRVENRIYLSWDILKFSRWDLFYQDFWSVQRGNYASGSFYRNRRSDKIYLNRYLRRKLRGNSFFLFLGVIVTMG